MDLCEDTSDRGKATSVGSSPEILSPGGKSRYGRTRRPKIERDFYNIDDVFIEEKPVPRHSPIKSPKLKPPPKSPIVKLDSPEPVFQIKDEFTKIDDLGMKVANNFKTNLHRGLDDSIKERKFFKSLPENKMEVPNVVDVTKVFKLISAKQNIVPDINETKTTSKTALKTYTNKRKHVHDSDNFICESFGLPDEPIVPVSSPFMFDRDTKIDIDMSCEDDVNCTMPWSFDEFQPLPLYASEPVTPLEDFSFMRGGVLDLFSCDGLLSDCMNINGVLDEKFEKSRIPTPVIPTIRESAKGMQNDEHSDEIKESVKYTYAKRRGRMVSSSVPKNRQKGVENTKVEGSNIKNLFKVDTSTGETSFENDIVVESVKNTDNKKNSKSKETAAVAEVNSGKTKNVNKVRKLPQNLDESQKLDEDIKLESFRRNTLRSTSEAGKKNEETSKITNMKRKLHRNLAKIEKSNENTENSIATEKTIEVKAKKMEKENFRKILLRSSVDSDESVEFLESSIDGMDNTCTRKRVLRSSVEPQPTDVKENSEKITNSNKKKQFQVADDSEKLTENGDDTVTMKKRVLRSTVGVEEAVKDIDTDKVTSTGIKNKLHNCSLESEEVETIETEGNKSERTEPLNTRKRILRSSLESEAEEEKKTLSKSVEISKKKHDIVDTALKDTETVSNDPQIEKDKEKVVKVINKKLSPVKKKFKVEEKSPTKILKSPTKILKSPIKILKSTKILKSPNNNTEGKNENLLHSSSLPSEQSSSSIKQNSLRYIKNDLKVKSQVVNPVNLSKMMAGPQVRVLLNPLSIFDKPLVLNPFKLKSDKPRLTARGRKRKLHNKLEFPEKIIDKDEKTAEDDVKDIKTEIIEFEVGDLAWAKIGSHPYWPCMVTEEPESRSHKRVLLNRVHPVYHVRFFGDKGRRSWVSAQNVMLYYGRDDLDKLKKTLKAENRVKSSYINECCKIREKKLDKWQSGVNEAESLKIKSVQQRLNYFFEIFASKREKKQKLKESLKKGKVLKTHESPSKKKRSILSESEHSSKKLKLESVEVKEEEDEQGSMIVSDIKKEEEIEEESLRKKGTKQELQSPEVKKLNISFEKSPNVDRKTKEVSSTTSKKLSKKEQSSDESTEIFKSPKAINILGTPEGHKKTAKKYVPNGGVGLVSPETNKKIKKLSQIDEETLITVPLPFKKSDRKSEEGVKTPENRQKVQKTTPVIGDTSDDDVLLSVKVKSPKKSQKKDESSGENKKKNEAKGGTLTPDLKKNVRRHSQSDVEDIQASDGRKRYLKKEEFSEESIEARKKLRNSSMKTDTGESPEPTKESQELGKKSKRNSIEEIPHQENEETEDEAPKIRNKRHQIGGEYSNSDTDSKFSDNSSVPASLESQAALYRRNNIFRGISKEKICQICHKNGEVFKCKGPCSGVYHYDCAIEKVKDEKNKGKEKKNGKDKESKEEKNNVEIISFNSKQPLPNLSDSPNFQGMTLAEKIDFRMKEIMKKFDYQTYADSTDSSSEEFLMDESHDKIKNQSKLSLTVTNKPSKKEVPIIKHVTADNVSYICVTDEPPKVTKEIVAIIKGSMKCGWCLNDETPNCLVCNKEESKSGSKFRQKCSLHQCGKFYHPECLKSWPQTQWSLIQSTKDKKSDERYDTFVCPRHVCHTCISDDPRASNSRCSSDKVVKCLKCPATYHSSNYCVPAGTHILSTSQIVCPRHYSKDKSSKKRMQQTINTNWCFICSKGGDLICCETCPTSVHVECLPGDLNELDTFYCEDCQSGRLPLYDEIVWVKLGSFRWWPALILFPNEVPDNVKNIAHNKGEFVVKFFGTYDHYWVGRGRTFLFQEGDKGHSHSVKKKVDSAFMKAIEEAAAAHQLKKQFKLNKVAEKNSVLKPPPYIRIKVNKPVGNVRLGDGNTSNTTSCECDPNQPHPCGPDSDCLNRLLLTECNPEVCPAGDRCNNQCFEKREYPPLIPHKTHARGWGLKTLAPIRKGQFVIEYVGEVIDEQEYQRRIQKMHEQKEENYYFLTIDKDRTLDAGPKGNVARFMNHSCQPNCETQKWTVNGDTRVGLFATCDIPADTELTFNYNLECIGKEKKICKCGAPNCSGFIGVKVKSDVPPRKTSRPRKKKSPPPEVVNIENPCFVCGKTGDVTGCCNKICTKYYHLGCVGLKSWPEGGKWVCQWHNCNICSKRTIRCCVKCVNSYCPSHSEGYVRYDKLLGFVCFEHDPTKEIFTTETPSKVDNANVHTEEGAVTSTTPDEVVTDNNGPSDEIDDELDSLSLQTRLNGAITSTPLKKSKEESSQDESTVSSASTSDVSTHSRRKKKIKKKVVKEKIDIQVKNTANLFHSTQNEVKLSNFTPVKYLRTSRNSSNVLNRTDPEKDLPIRKRTRLRCSNPL